MEVRTTAAEGSELFVVPIFGRRIPLTQYAPSGSIDWTLDSLIATRREQVSQLTTVTGHRAVARRATLLRSSV